VSNHGLLGGPPAQQGMEPLAAHTARVGARPAGGAGLIGVLERSALRGRGGGAFPVGTKWRSVAARGRAVVLVNGAEGEPLSQKDRVLMELRPHLVLDGAALAAESVGAGEVVLYLGQAHTGARAAMERALRERPGAERRRTRVVAAPPRYVAGEETAAVHCVNDGVALPLATPPRPFERGVRGRPTLVQNVESLAHAALIARHGDAWFRAQGLTAPGTVLLTVSGAVVSPGVVEVGQGTTVADAVRRAGGLQAAPRAVLLGGYFGSWADAGPGLNLPLDGAALAAASLTLGCGIVAVLPEGRCGVAETSRILAHLADESARQCGPCVFGLRAIAQAVERIARGAADAGDLARVDRWSTQLRGRGACGHPDGAVGMVQSALGVFAEDFVAHQQDRRCLASAARSLVAA
jgi:NADH:ubiquinone oxidoreductase subunit F (NADH-binding)